MNYTNCMTYIIHLNSLSCMTYVTYVIYISCVGYKNTHFIKSSNGKNSFIRCIENGSNFFSIYNNVNRILSILSNFE